WLGKGENTITVAADGDTSLASRAFTGRITADARFANNESTTSLGVTFDNLDVKDGSCWWKGGVGTMTVPVETPGELAALRFCTQYRARGAKDAIRVTVSFDEGKTWKDATTLAGPTPGKTDTARFADVPPGSKKALVRYELSGNNTVGIFSFRVDADYKDPHAAKEFRPFVVVYRWNENGAEKTDKKTIDRLPCTYKINTAGTPEMVSVTYEMPAK